MLKQPGIPSPHDHFFWLLGKGKNAQWAIHKGRWKLLGNAKDQTDRKNVKTLASPFLVDLEADVGETTNVAAEHSTIVEELQAIADQHRTSIESK